MKALEHGENLLARFAHWEPMIRECSMRAAGSPLVCHPLYSGSPNHRLCTPQAPSCLVEQRTPSTPHTLQG